MFTATTLLTKAPDPLSKIFTGADWRWRVFDSGVPLVDVRQIEDDSKFDCPRPWYLMCRNIGLSMLYAMTVCGAFFFMVAAPAHVTPKCYLFPSPSVQIACSLNSLVCWTYPLICILAVGCLYFKNMVDARFYYELLLTRILIDYESAKFYHSPTVILIILSGVFAFCNFAWIHAAEFHRQDGLLAPVDAVGLMGALAYISPVMSFMCLVMSNWSIDGQLIPLPRYYMADYKWAIELLRQGTPYTLQQLEQGYIAAEEEMDKANVVVSTSEMIALMVHHAPPKADARIIKRRPRDGSRLYWVARLLCFNPHLQDARSAEYRRWARIYMVYLFFLSAICFTLLFATSINCLDLLRLVDLERHPKLWWLRLNAADSARRVLRHKLGLIQVVGQFVPSDHVVPVH
eukprot:TRINITY_DN74496_c0_g1_i1.p1 TRINITY_DN74496_c0_g1~~TRINITY_DN74496_c0_g1_i1.p1  ORF type:complete len:402 (+),score=76.58 TRINITY_DN74496_c0_g1_i1:92-1297(+)